jgi:hypothetical protein
MRPEDEKTLTIARRTKKNLEYIYQSKDEGKDVEEFTQLLNSMLGMVISLREDYYKGDSIPWDTLEHKGLLQGKTHLETITGKKATHITPSLQQVDSFSQLLRNTRLGHQIQTERICFST